MSEVQIPSTKINQFFNSPQGGKSLSESEDSIQPTLDVTDFLYTRLNGSGQINTEAGETLVLSSLESGVGTYRVRLLFSGYIQGGVTPGQTHRLVLSVGGYNFPIFSNYLSASLLINFNPTVLDFIIDLYPVNAPDIVVPGNWSLVYTSEVDPTEVLLDVTYDIMRIA